MYYHIAEQRLMHKPTRVATVEGTLLGDIPEDVLMANGIIPFIPPVFDKTTHRAGAIVVVGDSATREVTEKTQQERTAEANAAILAVISRHMPEALELVLRWVWVNRATNGVTPELRNKIKILIGRWNEIKA